MRGGFRGLWEDNELRFSERLGYAPPRIALEDHELPQSLRAKLWNLIDAEVIKVTESQRSQFVYSDRFHLIISFLSNNFFYKPIDTIEYPSIEKRELRDKFFSMKFPQFYDFIEMMSEISNIVNVESRKNFKDSCNRIFINEKCPFRFVEDRLAKVVDEVEIKEIERAANVGIAGVKAHVSQAVALFAKRPDPDYRNSIKESISAVEAAVKHISGDPNATLGAALKFIEKSNGMHPALKEGFSKLYGYTSDANGIRHALMNEDEVSEAEARWMIVSCSAFVNYLISMASSENTT